ncbi:hypothetical protein FNSP10_07220 [Fusobacterium nucleatum]|nr:hypothetical protein FNCP10_21880 [Fusobacterium nucleatum]BEP07348.1 hypothetical protein FNSP10_07220 [Fusobacterium nucleatum]
MAIRTLSINIMSYLKGQGFQAVNNQINGLKSSLSSLKSVASNGLFQMAAGYFAISSLVEQYNKAVEASNLQLENETKLYATLRAQNFRDEQIQGLKDYASELQGVGVVGDEVSLAGIRQLATFKLNEESIRELLPQVQNLMVAEKGLKATSMDAEKWSKSLGVAVTSGQVRALKQAGIVLDEHTQKVFENATQQERIAILAKEIKERVGEQNAEFLKTPEGKIVSAQNRIGDIYEYLGGLVRDTRADFWSMIADNAEWIQDFLGGLVKAGAGAFNTITRTIGGIFNVLKALPPEARNTIKLITGFLLLKQFPVISGFLIIEDIFAAFLGKESFTEDAINAILKFTGTDYRFEDLRKGIADFWDLLINKSDSGIEKITLTTKVLSDLLDLLKSGAGMLQMIWGVTGGVVIDLVGNTFKAFEGDFQGMNWNNVTSNISSGWDKVYGAGQNWNKTDDMYQKYVLDEAMKQQQKEFETMKYVQKNQGNIAFPVEKRIVIPGSAPITPLSTYGFPYENKTGTNYEVSSKNREIQQLLDGKNKEITKAEAYYAPRLPDKKIAQDTKQKVEKSIVKKENKKFEYVNNSKYEIKVTGEVPNDVAKKVEGVVRRIQEEEKQRLRAEIGGNYTQAGGLE